MPTPVLLTSAPVFWCSLHGRAAMKTLWSRVGHIVDVFLWRMGYRHRGAALNTAIFLIRKATLRLPLSWSLHLHR